MNQTNPLVLFKGDLTRLHDAGELALPDTVPFKNFKNAAIVAVTDNPSILQCNRESVFKAIRTLAGAGLVPDGREAAIVPFRGAAQAMPMVAGLVKIARNSGKISSLWADVVYDKERLEIWVEDGERRWNHVTAEGEHIDAMARGGEIRGAYAVAKLTDGTVEFQPMSRDEIEKRRMASANQKGPKPTGIWEKWYDEMAKKTVIRNLCKRLPMSADDMDRMLREQEPLLRDVTPEPEPERKNLAQRITETPAIDGEIVDDEKPFSPDPFSDEYKAGSEAFKNGAAISECPHTEGAALGNWLAGYNFEQSQAA